MPFKQTIGSTHQVMNGTARKTSGGLHKKHLKYNPSGRIVSKKASALAKNNNRLVKAGYVTTKGVFGCKLMKGGGSIYKYKNNTGEFDTLQLHQLHAIKLLENSHTDTINYGKEGDDYIFKLKKTDKLFYYEMTKDGGATATISIDLLRCTYGGYTSNWVNINRNGNNPSGEETVRIGPSRQNDPNPHSWVKLTKSRSTATFIGILYDSTANKIVLVNISDELHIPRTTRDIRDIITECMTEATRTIIEQQIKISPDPTITVATRFSEDEGPIKTAIAHLQRPLR